MGMTHHREQSRRFSKRIRNHCRKLHKVIYTSSSGGRRGGGGGALPVPQGNGSPNFWNHFTIQIKILY
ncbi:hypothetical protein Y032_0211g2209 [Ancylostoma ceylanicum]|uniref:Uncharacterized protein n=1 Tax=Ancylostoma ceylanicum TaxID=53326 RepID=A0A016SL96_9BILA|nr:hypothetical protein Y032_0211g2209 [Ancylostoma ceylanicum]